MLTITHQAPTFTTQDASRFAYELYGLHASACLLPGEHDQNFHLKTETGQEFVLKIAHPAEQYEVLDLQNKALAHLATHAPSLSVPRVHPSTTGTSIATITNGANTTHLVRLLTYLPGKVLAHTNPHTAELLHNLGNMLGTLDSALQNFTHPAAHRALKWDLPRASWIRDYIQYIVQPEHRALIERLLTQFETHLEPVLPTLRTSIIHNDANDYNILIDNSQHRPTISLVDFGDMLHTCTIDELAIAATYAMMGKSDPITAAAHLVSGYHEIFPLSESELEMLYPLICMRLCISVTNSAYQQQIEPDNNYLIISEQPAWTLLEQLININPQLAHYTFRHACGLPPCPKTNAVVQWLKSNTDKIGRHLEISLPVRGLERGPACHPSLRSGSLGQEEFLKSTHKSERIREVIPMAH